MPYSSGAKLVMLLAEMETVLRKLGCWSGISPSAAALQSRKPFCLDTLDFDQWLQWVFIPRMRQIIDDGEPLPTSCNMVPMVEEWRRPQTVAVDDLIMVLREVDLLLTI